MTKPAAKKVLPSASLSHSSSRVPLDKKVRSRRSAKSSKKQDSSDVLVSAVISSYLLTHLHHVLQHAEFGAAKEGRCVQAQNFAQLRKVLCMDARSMQDASASGSRDTEFEKYNHSKISHKAA
tara:strand:+ start:63 stop:431 length:369 start_codon:yes stop_codon:yes gene_type:complete